MVAKKTTSRKITVPYFTKSGSKSGSVTLSKEIFGQEPNKVILAQAVRVFLSNQRNAHAKTKRRSDVRSSKRKIYRQKGTGGARHGARSAPIFVGGGITHGPTGAENYKMALSKKMRKSALASALSSKVHEESVVVADIDKVGPKTKDIVKVLEKIGKKGKNATLVHSGGEDLFRAARNITGIDVVVAGQLTAYHVLTGGSLVLTKDAVSNIESRFDPKEAKPALARDREAK